MLKRDFNFKIKSVDDEKGTFTGDLSVYILRYKDHGGDVVQPGTVAEPSQNKGNVVPLLWQHKSDVPIGTLTLVDSPSALRVTGKLLMKLPMAEDAYELIKGGVIAGLSIGYDVLNEDFQNGIRYLKELRLWEGSIVTFPMNEMAMITSIKADDPSDDEEEVAALQAIFASLQRLGSVLKQ